MRNYIRHSELINAYIIEYSDAMKGYGGWGCGYVEIKKDHPVYKLAQIEYIGNEGSFYYQLPMIGEEITFCEFEDDVLILGFDTAHSYNTIENSGKDMVVEATLKMFDQCNVYYNEDVELAKEVKLNELKELLNQI